MLRAPPDESAGPNEDSGSGPQQPRAQWPQAAELLLDEPEEPEPEEPEPEEPEPDEPEEEALDVFEVLDDDVSLLAAAAFEAGALLDDELRLSVR